jgi:hypothetical protein
MEQKPKGATTVVCAEKLRMEKFTNANNKQVMNALAPDDSFSGLPSSNLIDENRFACEEFTWEFLYVAEKIYFVMLFNLEHWPL